MTVDDKKDGRNTLSFLGLVVYGLAIMPNDGWTMHGILRVVFLFFSAMAISASLYRER